MRIDSISQTCERNNVVIREYIRVVNIMSIIERSEYHLFNCVLLLPYDYVVFSRGGPP
jgi:hypothetical protein